MRLPRGTVPSVDSAAAPAVTPSARSIRTAAIQLAPALTAIPLLVLSSHGCDGGTTIEEPVATTVEVSPESAILSFVNATQGFTAVVRDQNGKAMPGATVSWSGSDAGVFTFSGSGALATVTSVANGMGTLTATSGQASGAASVEVKQTPTKVEMVSGDDQEARRGTALPEPIVLRVEDQGGTGVPGEPVTFLPDEGSGSVGSTTVETDAHGLASTEWTLGTDLRRQSVLAATGDLTLRFMASATSDPPMPDLVLKNLKLSRLEPTIHETVDVEAVVTNDGDGSAPAAFSVHLVTGGTRTEAIRLDALDPGASTTARFTIGPLGEGDHRIEVVVDPNDEVAEWHEDNNSRSGHVTVQAQLLLELGESVTVSSDAPGPALLYRVEIEEASDEPLNVRLSGGQGDADLFVHYGERPEHHYYRCFSNNRDSNEYCQLVPTRKGVYHIAVRAFTGFGPSTLTVTVGGVEPASYDLELLFVRGGTTSQRNIISQAADRWMSIIARDINLSLGILSPPGFCGPDSPNFDQGVDDMAVLVMIDSIDGVGGSIGSAAPCIVRPYPYEAAGDLFLPPILGYVRLDEDDVDLMESDGVLLALATHKLAHALGFHEHYFSLRLGLLRDPSLPETPNADTHFAGQRSIAAFDAAGGAGYAGARVPVENGAQRGLSDRHWRQSVFGDELMTPFLTGEVQPLSVITLEAMYDLGYEVNLTEADAYRLPAVGVAGVARPREPVIDLRHDAPRTPVRVWPIRRKGRK